MIISTARGAITYWLDVPGPVNLPLHRYNPCDWEAITRIWLESVATTSYHRVALVYFQDPGFDGVRRVLEEHYHQAKLGDNTIATKSVNWARNFLENLKGCPPLALSSRPLEGRTAIIVSGGPSLDGNGALLPALQSQGAVIIAVDVSAAACIKHGCMPDVVVSVEERDSSTALSATDGQTTHVLDMTASVNSWETPARNRLAICHPDPSFIPYLIELGTKPLGYSHNVGAAATSLAITWGAAKVVLTGQDLAYNGQSHASGCSIDPVTTKPGDGVVEFSDGRRRALATLPGWGGGTVYTDTSWLASWKWFCRIAKDYPLTNATEGGAWIDGATEARLSEVLSWDHGGARKLQLPSGEGPDTSAVLAGIRDEAQRVLDSLDAYVMHPASAAILNRWMDPAMLKVNAQALSPKQREEALRAALEGACKEVIEVIG